MALSIAIRIRKKHAQTKPLFSVAFVMFFAFLVSISRFFEVSLLWLARFPEELIAPSSEVQLIIYEETVNSFT